MKILFDLYSTQPSKSVFHGGGIYGQNVFMLLMKSERVLSGEVTVSAALNPDKVLPREITDIIDTNKLNTIECRNAQEIKRLLYDSDFDLFYSPLPNYLVDLLDKPLPRRMVVTFHDLRDFDMSYDWFARQYQPCGLKRFRLFILSFFEPRVLNKLKQRIEKFLSLLNYRIITDSLHSKYRFLTEFPKLGRVPVYYAVEKQRADILSDGVNEVMKKFSLESKKYFLLISCNRPVKNAIRVIAALDKYKTIQTDIVFLCVGFNDGQIRRVKKLYPTGYKFCRFIPYVSENELTVLYRESFCFIFPSISEGYGYPPIEAMRQGVPVIASAVTSIPEVCGDAVLYMNPFNIGEIANRINRILCDSDLRRKLIEKGFARAAEIDNIHNGETRHLLDEILGQ